MIAPHIGPALRLLRRQRGLTQKTVAERAKISKSVLSNWETGTTFPSWGNLAKALAVLKADLLDLHEAVMVVSGRGGLDSLGAVEHRHRISVPPIGPAIRLLRRRYNLTQRAMAEAAEISKNLISHWETGATAPSLNCLDRIVTRVPKVDLLTLHNTLCLLSGKPTERLGAAVESSRHLLFSPQSASIDDLDAFLAQAPSALHWTAQLHGYLQDPEALDQICRRLRERGLQ